MEGRKTRAIRRPGSPVLFALTMITAIIIGWSEDHRSCIRSNGQRASLTIFYEGQLSRAEARARFDPATVRGLDRQAVRADVLAVRQNRPLACSGLLPATR